MNEDRLARIQQWKRLRPTKSGELHKLLVGHGVPIRVVRPVAGQETTAGRYPPGAAWEKHLGPLDVDEAWLAQFRDTVTVDGIEMTVGAIAILGERAYGKGVSGGLDVIDVDPRSGGKESWERLVELEAVPKVLAWQRTASGGWHAFIHPLGLRKIRNLLPGLDYLAGTAAGEGRAFVYITPTLGISKGPDPEPGSNSRYVVDADLAEIALPEGYDWRGGADRLRELAVEHKRRPEKKPERAKSPTRRGGGSQELDPRWAGYLAGAVTQELDRLRELHGLPWDRGHGHDQTTYAVAATLLDLADSAWNPWTREEAESAWRAALDPAYTDHWIATKWRSAEASVTGDGRPEPDFTGHVPLDVSDIEQWGQALASGAAYDPDDPFCAGTTSDGADPLQAFERDVAKEIARERVRREARRRLAAESETGERFVVLTAAQLDEMPDEPRMRVAGMIPWGAGTLVVARRKVGKTTFVLNLVRSLLSGEKFLGEYDVIPVAENKKVAFLNYELSAGQMKIWVRDVGLRANSHLLVVNLKGCRNPLSHPEDRAALAEQLREANVEIVVVDPFRVAASGIEQNSASEVSAWLAELDDFVRAQVGATEVVLIAHAGKVGESARGNSALEDWPDSIINVEKRDDGQRTFGAFGRDVDIDTRFLSFEESTRRLTAGELVEEGRVAKARKLSDRDAAVVQIVRDNPGITTNKIAAKLSILRLGLRTTAELTRLIDVHEERGLLRREPGPRNSMQHFATDAQPANYAVGLEVFDDTPDD